MDRADRGNIRTKRWQDEPWVARRQAQIRPQGSLRVDLLGRLVGGRERQDQRREGDSQRAKSEADRGPGGPPAQPAQGSAGP